MSELLFPKADQRSTHVRLTVGKYKKAIVTLKDRDSLKGVEGIYQHGYLESKRIFKPVGESYIWDGFTYLDKDGKPYEKNGAGTLQVKKQQSKK